jgi:hypothetical protein
MSTEKKMVLVIKHIDADVFFDEQHTIKVSGGYANEIPEKWHSEDTDYLPKSIAFVVPVTEL